MTVEKRASWLCEGDDVRSTLSGIAQDAMMDGDCMVRLSDLELCGEARELNTRMNEELVQERRAGATGPCTRALGPPLIAQVRKKEHAGTEPRNVERGQEKKNGSSAVCLLTYFFFLSAFAGLPCKVMQVAKKEGFHPGAGKHTPSRIYTPSYTPH